jgi:molybdenum cofactor cytidylyltransferase
VSLPVVLVLASGRGERFIASGGSGSKLQALLAGKPVLERTLDAVRASGLPWHLEDTGHEGMGDSIAAALRATQDAAGWLVLPADLPLVLPQTLRMVAAALQRAAVVLPHYQGRRGHPVGFAASCRDRLLALKGPQGAAAVILDQGKGNLVLQLDLEDWGTVTDIDTVQDLVEAEQLLVQSLRNRAGGLAVGADQTDASPGAQC